jgi:hypothetical protein
VRSELNRLAGIDQDTEQDARQSFKSALNSVLCKNRQRLRAGQMEESPTLFSLSLAIPRASCKNKKAADWTAAFLFEANGVAA